MQIDNNTVAIMLAAYNGEKFIAEQIESILRQSYQNWILFIRDDGSSDLTVEIVEDYCKKFPQRMVLVRESSEKHGSNANFAALHKYVTKNYSFSYFMFCDQDDLWLKNKIEITLRRMKEAEAKAKGNVPSLVHTDLKVVNEELQILSDSYFKYRTLHPDFTDLRHLLVQNNATGCTMMWNKKLNEIVGDSLSNEEVFQHDWWMSLTACCFGKIFIIKEPTILYRQHRENSIGATHVNSLGFIIKRLSNLNHVRRTLSKSVEQSGAFLNTYLDELTGEQTEIIRRYSSLYERNKLIRMFGIIRDGFFKQGILQIIGELVFF